MVERSRTQIHQSDHQERGEIADAETIQLKELSKKLTDHITDNKDQFLSTSNALGKLEPLADKEIIDTIKRIVKREEGNQIFAQMINQWIGRLGKILGVLVALGAIIWYTLSIMSGQFRGK